MKSSWPLYTGLLLLSTGLLLNLYGGPTVLATLLMAAGITLKSGALVGGLYAQPDRGRSELAILGAGLAFFLAGLTLKADPSAIHPWLLMGAGLTVKVTFAVRVMGKPTA
ncbi:MAG: hypothetical protein ACYTGH_06145 [Planctomycetota bacterium]|jgi:hypothetical protein